MIIIITRWNHQALNSGRHHRIISNQKKKDYLKYILLYFLAQIKEVLSFPLITVIRWCKQKNIMCFSASNILHSMMMIIIISRFDGCNESDYSFLILYSIQTEKTGEKKCKCSNQFFILSIGHFLFGLLNWMRIEQSKTKKKLSMWIWKKNLRIRIVCMWGKNWCFSFFVARFFLDLAVLRLLFPAIRGSFRPNHGCFRLFSLVFGFDWCDVDFAWPVRHTHTYD